MPAITSVDLNNAKLDVDHIAAIATSTQPTATDRLGNSKLTMQGATDRINTAVYTATAFTDRGTWAPSTIYAVKDLVKESSTWYVCLAAHTSSAAFVTDQATKWRIYQGVTSGDLGASTGIQLVGGVISVNTTLNVPSQYATINEAVAYLMGKTIASTAIVTVAVADGTYTMPNVVYLNHPQGDRIEIVGNSTTPSNCVLNYASSDGFYLEKGFTLRKLDGFRVVKTGARGNLGILTDGGKYLAVGPKIEVHNFYYGISARNNGYVNCGGNITNFVKVTNSGDCGIWAFIGSNVVCDYAEVSGSDDSANGLGGGIVAEFGSSIQANNTNVHNNWLCGFSSISNSVIRAWDCNAHDNQMGMITGSGGRIEVFGLYTLIQNNTVYGSFCGDADGVVYGLGTATMSGNVLGNEHSKLVLDSAGSLEVRSASLKLNGNLPGVQTGGDTYFDMNCKANGFNIMRVMEANTERSRLQYRHDVDVWEMSINGLNVFRTFIGGKVALGRNNTSVGDTTGFVQIPKVSGAPTGLITDNSSGYVSLVYDATNSRLCIHDGSFWKYAQLA